jgi:deoxyhypusine synthase
MIFISHRGNINMIFSDRENSPDYIDEAISQGYDVEMDVRLIGGKLYLGHDEPQYEIILQWLLDRKNNLWVHTKNFEVLSYLITEPLRTFYHQKENHTIINFCNLIWSHELSEANERSIIPLISQEDIVRQPIPQNVYGICSDFVDLLRGR